MNKYNFKKILEDHSLYYLEYRYKQQLCIQRDYVRGWTDTIYDLANKTGIKLYSGILNDLLCRFSTIHNISEILSDSFQVVIIPHHIIDKDAYLKGHDNVCEYINLKIMGEQ